MSKTNYTLDYYNNNAQKFIEGTVSVEFGSMQNRFLDKLEKGASMSLIFGFNHAAIEIVCFLMHFGSSQTFIQSFDIIKAATVTIINFLGLLKHAYAI